MLVSAVIAGVLVGLAAKGDLRKLATVDVRRPYLFFGAVALRTAALFPVGAAIQRLVYLGALLLLLVTGLINWRLPGARIASLGIGLNAIAVTLGGGAMPVSAVAVAAAGVHTPTDALHVLSSSPSALGDVFPIPLLGVYSIGDALLAAGVFVLIVSAMRGAA